MSSTLLGEDTGVPFDQLQAEQIAVFARGVAGLAPGEREPRVSVAGLSFALVTDEDRRLFGRRDDTNDQIGWMDGAPVALRQELHHRRHRRAAGTDAAVAAADRCSRLTEPVSVPSTTCTSLTIVARHGRTATESRRRARARRGPGGGAAYPGRMSDRTRAEAALTGGLSSAPDRPPGPDPRHRGRDLAPHRPALARLGNRERRSRRIRRTRRMPRPSCRSRRPPRRRADAATPTQTRLRGRRRERRREPRRPSPSATPVAEPCLTRDVTVEAVTDQPTYASGPEPAAVDPADQQRRDRLHAQRRDRARRSSRSRAAATPGGGPRTARASRATWSCCSPPARRSRARRRSPGIAPAPPSSTCADADRPRAPGGGASYHLAVEIGGIASTESRPAAALLNAVAQRAARHPCPPNGG